MGRRVKLEGRGRPLICKAAADPGRDYRLMTARTASGVESFSARHNLNLAVYGWKLR